MSRRSLIINARHIRSVRYLLLIGLLLTIFAPFLLIAWHEIFDTQQHRPLFHSHSSQHHLLSSSLDESSARLKQTTSINNDNGDDWPPVLTVYSEPDSSYDIWYENPSTNNNKKQKLPLPQRNVHKNDLTRLHFPKLTYQQQNNDNKHALHTFAEFTETAPPLHMGQPPANDGTANKHITIYKYIVI